MRGTFPLEFLEHEPSHPTNGFPISKAYFHFCAAGTGPALFAQDTEESWPIPLCNARKELAYVRPAAGWRFDNVRHYVLAG